MGGAVRGMGLDRHFGDDVVRERVGPRHMGIMTPSKIIKQLNDIVKMSNPLIKVIRIIL